MKKFIFILFISFFIILPLKAEVITVNNGTIVPVEIQIDINSRKLKADDLVPIIVVRDIEVNNKVVFPKGAEGYLRVFDCTKVDTWGSNWRKGATVEFDGAGLKDATGKLRKFSFNECFKGADITVGTAVSTISNTQTQGTVNAIVNGSTNITNPYRASINAQSNAYGVANYSENANSMTSSIMNGHRFIGENIMIKKGHRFRIETAETFKIEL